MQTALDWSTALREMASRLQQSLAQLLPSLLGALALLVAGWVAGRLLRALTVRVVHLLDRQLQRLLQRERPRLPPASADVLGRLVFWVVMLLFAAAAAQVLGLTVVLGWLDRLVAFLPTLLAAAVIVLAGFLLGKLASDLIGATAGAGSPAQRALLARGAQALTVVSAIVIGADQIGIRVDFLVILAAVALGTLLGGVALAVSLGARTYVANLIGMRHLREHYEVGQVVRVGGHEGRILELTPIAVVLETEAGRATLPGKLFGEEPTLLVVPGEGDGPR